MKIWQTYLLVAAILASPHLPASFALGGAIGWFGLALWIAGRGD